MKAARVDSNQTAIVKHLRSLGWTVHITSRLGDGFPDLAVTREGWGSFAALVEIKDGSKPPSARKLTPAEVAFWKAWDCEPLVVFDPADAEKKLAKFL